VHPLPLSLQLVASPYVSATNLTCHLQLLDATSRLQKAVSFFDGSLYNSIAAVALKPSLPCIESHPESLKNAIVSRWHFAMLNDEIRNAQYQRALQLAVYSWALEGNIPTVLDIGAGAALLSLCVWKAGGGSRVSGLWFRLELHQ